MAAARRLGRFGIWRSAGQVTPELAAGIERLGFGALWLGSSPAGDLAQAEELLDTTTTLTLATSIVNMWQDQPEHVARSFARVQRRHPGRFLLGVGAGHREATQQYARPYQALARYVDVLQAGASPATAWCWPPWARRCSASPGTAPPAPSLTSSRPSTPARRGPC
jgi:probable F420-dependent oxidoreductase